MPSLQIPRRTTLWKRCLERISGYDRISGPRIWFVVERDMALLKGAVQSALGDLSAKEGEA
jgi:hypothetical protein